VGEEVADCPSRDKGDDHPEGILKLASFEYVLVEDEDREFDEAEAQNRDTVY